MDYRGLFADVRERPGAYGLDGSYRQTVAFITGCDAGSSWQLLAGFREWLATKLGYGANLAWPELVRRVASLPSAKDHVTNAPEGKQNTEAISALFDLLDAFLATKEEIIETEP